MPELRNVRVWYDPNTGRLQVTAQGDPVARRIELKLKHITLRFEYGHGSSVETSHSAHPGKRRPLDDFEHEVQWAHQISSLDSTWVGDAVVQVDERAAYVSAAIVRQQLDPATDRVDVICRNVWTRATDWCKASSKTADIPGREAK